MKDTIRLIHLWKKSKNLPGFIPSLDGGEILLAPGALYRRTPELLNTF